MTGRTYQCRLNGSDAQLVGEPTDIVLGSLRGEERLYSVRESCGIGVCGTCTILLDGEPVSSCLIPLFAVEGREIVTIEGLGTVHELHEVQAAFADEQGFQCSFCTPGFIVSATRMVEEEAEIDEATIREYLGGHLCRCGSYETIRSAVVRASQRHRSPRTTEGTVAAPSLDDGSVS